MDGSRADLESRVALLEGALGDVRARVAALEGGSMPRAAATAGPADTLPAFAAPAAPVPLQAVAAADAADDGAPVASALTLAGRTFLVLGGAFLLRTLTEAGRVPASLGALLGLAYALAWIGLALRDGARGARTSAVVHGLTAALVAYPLVGEAATRMGAFAPAPAAAALAVVTAALVAAGRRTGLPVLVWTGVLAGAATSGALFVATGAIAVFVSFLLALYAASLALRRGSGAEGLEWPPGILAALLLALGAWLSTRAEGTPERWTALSPTGIAVLALALVALALLGAAHDAKARGLAPTDVLQPAAALTVAAGLLFGGPAVAVLWGLLGIILAARAPRDGRGWMAWLAAALVAGAAGLSGLLRVELAAFLAAPDALASPSGPAVLVAIAAAAAFIVAAAGAPDAPAPRPGAVLVSAAVASGSTLALVIGLAPFTSTAPGLALARTVVLCGAALAVAWTVRFVRFGVASVLAYPILAAAGLKLLVGDLRVGGPATLTAAFAVYGVTLLLVPRLLRRKRRERKTS
jgi:hypothetical protein